MDTTIINNIVTYIGTGFILFQLLGIGYLIRMFVMNEDEQYRLKFTWLLYKKTEQNHTAKSITANQADNKNQGLIDVFVEQSTTFVGDDPEPTKSSDITNTQSTTFVGDDPEPTKSSDITNTQSTTFVGDDPEPTKSSGITNTQSTTFVGDDPEPTKSSGITNTQSTTFVGDDPEPTKSSGITNTQSTTFVGDDPEPTKSSGITNTQSTTFVGDDPEPTKSSGITNTQSTISGYGFEPTYGRKLRVGIIGVGAIATNPTNGHIPNYLHLPEVELVAISDVNGNRAQHIANRYNIPLVYTHFREMLANGELDAVSIAVPNYLHAAIAVGCLEKGVHVLVEKPMAMTSRDARRMVEAARTHKRVLFPGMNHRFREDSRALKSMMQQGALGEVYAAKAGWLSRTGTTEGSSWRTSKAQTGGSLLWDTGIVILDLALWMLGFPKIKSVTGAIHKAKGELPQLLSPTETSPYPVEDAATALIRFEGGRHLALEVSTPNLKGDADDIYLRLQGTSGDAELHNPEMKGTDVLRVQGELFGTTLEFTPVLRESGVPPHRNELKHFVDVCMGRTAPQITPEQGYIGVRIIEAIQKSALNGREVMFEKDFDTMENMAQIETSPVAV